MSNTSWFNKDEFKKNIISNCKSLFRKNIDEADKQQLFQSVAYAVKEIIIDRWIATQKEYAKQDKKTVYYMSMEFLMGRALGNNMINLMAYDEMKEVLEELGMDINVIEDRNLMQHSVTVVWEDLPHVSLIHLQHLNIRHMDAEYVINMVCLSRRLKMAIR